MVYNHQWNIFAFWHWVIDKKFIFCWFQFRIFINSIPEKNPLKLRLNNEDKRAQSTQVKTSVNLGNFNNLLHCLCVKILWLEDLSNVLWLAAVSAPAATILTFSFPARLSSTYSPSQSWRKLTQNHHLAGSKCCLHTWHNARIFRWFFQYFYTCN